MSFQNTTKLLLHLLQSLLVLLLVLDIRQKQIVQLLPNPVQRLFPLLQTLNLVLSHLMLVQQDLVLTVFVRIHVVLVYHSHDVVRTTRFIRSSLVRVVVVSALQTHRLVKRSHHRPSASINVVKCSMLKLSLVTVLLRNKSGLILKIVLLVSRIVVGELERTVEFVGETSTQKIRRVDLLLSRRTTHHVLHGFMVRQQIVPALLLPLRNIRIIPIHATFFINRKFPLRRFRLETITRPEFHPLQLKRQLRQTLNISQERVVALQPKLEVCQNTSNHRQLALMRMRQVNLNVILFDVRIDPSEDLPPHVRKNHVLVNDEETVMYCQLTTGLYDSLSVLVSPVRTVTLLQLSDGLVSKVLNPYFLEVGLRLAKNYFRSALDGLLLSFFIEIALFFRLDWESMANFIRLFHQQKQCQAQRALKSWSHCYPQRQSQRPSKFISSPKIRQKHNIYRIYREN